MRERAEEPPGAPPRQIHGFGRAGRNEPAALGPHGEHARVRDDGRPAPPRVRGDRSLEQPRREAHVVRRSLLHRREGEEIARGAMKRRRERRVAVRRRDARPRELEVPAMDLDGDAERLVADGAKLRVRRDERRVGLAGAAQGCDGGGPVAANSAANDGARTA